MSDKICFGCMYEPVWMPYNGPIRAGFCKYPLPVYIKNARILFNPNINKLYYQSKGYSQGHNDLWQSGGGSTTENIPFALCKGFLCRKIKERTDER